MSGQNRLRAENEGGAAVELKDFFAEHPKAALAFSGGTDSAWLLYAAVKWGADVRPYFADSAFQPRFELADARRLCGELGAELRVVPVDILSVPQAAANPPDLSLIHI